MTDLFADVPADWTVTRLKRFFHVQSGDFIAPTDETQDGIPIIGGNGVRGYTHTANVSGPALAIGRVGARCGCVHLVEKDFWASEHALVVYPRREFSLRYARYLLEVLDFNSQAIRTAQPLINTEIVEDTVGAFPPLPVQRLIAGYLDREVGRLDGLVAAKQRWLALLAEKRRALITRAVTRGLDPKALLRDSGLPWLGQMPKHWRTMRLKFCCDSLQTGPFGSQLHAEDYVEDGIPVVNPAHMQAGRIVPDSAMAVDEATAQRLSIHRLQRGDIVFARRGELGRCGLVTEAEERWLCGTGSIRARPHLDIVQPEYLISVAAYTGFAELLSLESVGTTMENINTEIIGDMAIPVPPLDEQRAIVAHIASETTKLDGLREATERTVALLLERRAALIAAAVTGKIDLPETKCQIDAVARERRPQPCV